MRHRLLENNQLAGALWERPYTQSWQSTDIIDCLKAIVAHTLIKTATL